MRFFIDISYKGTAYHGWQEQSNAITVQQVINEKLTQLLRTDTKCVGSGRTDTGVHAKQQLIHFDVQEDIDTDRLLYKLNAVLPEDIAANEIRRVRDDAHARFDATKRSYQYFLHTRKTPFNKDQSYFFPHAINLETIDEGCKIFKQWTDFESFSKVKTEVNHFDCEIFEIEWQRELDDYIFFVSANRFLRGMVRAMVGTLLDMGTGKLSPNQLTTILEQKDRRAASRSVPPQGLFLSSVIYPNDIYL